MKFKWFIEVMIIIRHKVSYFSSDDIERMTFLCTGQGK